SAGGELIPIRVIIFDEVDKRRKILIGASSETRVCDLPNHPDLKEFIGGKRCEWNCEGDVLKSVTISILSGITASRPIQLMCTVKK
ncbi:hypothetical protein PFISCL1PPCAC_11404, partial [Pristionchus fissidentatus]